MKKITVLLSLILIVTCAVCFVACGTLPITSDSATQGTKQAEQSIDEGKEYASISDAAQDVLSAGNFEGAEVPAYADDDFLVGYFGYVKFGMYPQTVATKDALKQMSQTTDSTGYYVSAFDGEHYARISTAMTYGEDYTFIDEKDITSREMYYFKVEPIKWRIFGKVDLASGMKTLYLLSDYILDSSSFMSANKFSEDPGEGVFYIKNGTDNPSNWLVSDLRTFLNDDFSVKAFTEEELAKIVPQKTVVTKSVFDETTGADKEVEEEYYDTAFALSYEKASSIEAGYRVAQLSDYARCRNTFMTIHQNWYGNGRWWTSTVSASDNVREKSYRVSYISDYIAKGDEDLVKEAEDVMKKGESVAATYMGVRPAIVLTVDDAIQIVTKEEEAEEQEGKK